MIGKNTERQKAKEMPLDSSRCYSCCPQLNPIQHPTTILPPCSTNASTATRRLQPCLWLSFNPYQWFFSPHSFFREVTSNPKPAFKLEARTGVHCRQLFLKFEKFLRAALKHSETCAAQKTAGCCSLLPPWQPSARAVWSTLLKSPFCSTAKHIYLI